MPVVVTRPRPQAEDLAHELERRGHDVLIEPMLGIEPLVAEPPSLAGVQALVVTSANAAPALRAFAGCALPVFAVGGATARAVRASGMADVLVAQGESASLAQLIAERCRPQEGAVLHLCGTEVREELREYLAACGFELQRHPVYRARTASALSPALIAAARARTLQAVLLFSPRTASTFIELALRHGLDPFLPGAEALCLSAAVAEPCQRITWRRVAVAARPTTAALLELLDGLERRW